MHTKAHFADVLALGYLRLASHQCDVSCSPPVTPSVKASLARSKSSEELLLGNAQQLLRAVSKTVRAAEAASLRVSADPRAGAGVEHTCAGL